MGQGKSVLHKRNETFAVSRMERLTLTFDASDSKAINIMSKYDPEKHSIYSDKEVIELLLERNREDGEVKIIKEALFDNKTPEILTEELAVAIFEQANLVERESLGISAVIEMLRNCRDVGIFLGCDIDHKPMFLSKEASIDLCSRPDVSVGTVFMFCDTDQWRCSCNVDLEGGECQETFSDYLAVNKPFSRYNLTQRDIDRWNQRMTYVGGIDYEGDVHIQPGQEQHPAAEILQSIASVFNEPENEK